MTTLAVSNTQIIAAQTHIHDEAFSSKEINYLNRCAVFLKPSTESYYNAWYVMKETASTVSLIAYGILVCASPFLLFCLPPMAAGIIISAAVLSSLALSFYSFVCREKFDMLLENFSRPSLERANASKEMREIHNKLSTSPSDIQKELEKIGISLPDLDPSIRADVTKLKPVLAHYLYWDKIYKEFSSKLTRESHNPFSRICNLEQLLRAKARMAFYYGILKSPNFAHKFTDMIKFSEFSEGRSKFRFVDQDWPRFDPNVFETSGLLDENKNKECLQINGTSLSYNRVLNISIKEFSKMIFDTSR